MVFQFKIRNGMDDGGPAGSATWEEFLCVERDSTQML